MDINNLNCDELNLIIKTAQQILEKKQKKRNAELFQEEQDLTAEIHEKNNAITCLKNEIIEKENLINDLQNSIANIKARLNEVNKEWNKSHSAKDTSVKMPNVVRQAFGILLFHYGEDMTLDDVHRTFKRFDNLVHCRCKTTEMFGYDWDISDVVDVLHDYAPDISINITDLYNEIVKS